MVEKLKRMTDPTTITGDGVDRVRWVQFAASTVFPRRSGKAVAKYQYYQQADANSSSLAGWLAVDHVGDTGGHPASVSAGDPLPVNMGLDKTGILPTSNRAATDADVGNSFALLVDGSNVQHVNMNSTNPGVVVIERVLDEAGSYVMASINPTKRYGNI